MCPNNPCQQILLAANTHRATPLTKTAHVCRRRFTLPRASFQNWTGWAQWGHVAFPNTSRWWWAHAWQSQCIPTDHEEKDE